MIKLSNCQIIKLSNYQMIKLSNDQTIKFDNYQSIKLSNYQIIKLSNYQIIKPIIKSMWSLVKICEGGPQTKSKKSSPPGATEQHAWRFRKRLAQRACFPDECVEKVENERHGGQRHEHGWRRWIFRNYKNCKTRRLLVGPRRSFWKKVRHGEAKTEAELATVKFQKV